MATACGKSGTVTINEEFEVDGYGPVRVVNPKISFHLWYIVELEPMYGFQGLSFFFIIYFILAKYFLQ